MLPSVQRLVSRGSAATVIAVVLMLAVACSSDPATTPAPASATPAPASVRDAAGEPTEIPPNGNITVSDAVPSLEALQDMGLGEQAAECFIATIDPNGTGRVESAELFMQAFASCV